MVYIKKLVLKGFKSFASETEIPFNDSMNVIVGPNGSGKSNITEAICFVLGRMSAKSMRASKSSNMIFAGTKEHKPSGEAAVKLVFDNSDKKIPSFDKEIVIERVVRRNGQGIYKINDEAKTRQEIIELLTQAGIDPYGFNIVLQGEISSTVKMHSEERRKVIEEVAGISIYEDRKEKSLRELEKTEERLKEVRTTLRERTAYLKNLEEERKQALKYKKLQEFEKRCKAGILKKKLEEKEKELAKLEEHQSVKENERNKLKEKADKINKDNDKLREEIEVLNKTIQKASGIEQGELNNEISNIRAELAGLEVRKDNSNSRLQETISKREKLKQEIEKLEKSIIELRKQFPSQAKQYKELEEKRKELQEIEDKRKKFYNLREKLNSIREISKDKERQIQKNTNEYHFLLKEADEISQNLVYNELEVCLKNLESFKKEHYELAKTLEKKEESLKEKEKLVSVYESEMSKSEKIKSDVSKLDICPLCKSKITLEHVSHVIKDCNDIISSLREKIQKIEEENLGEEIRLLKKRASELQEIIPKTESNRVKLESIESKKKQIKVLAEEKESLLKEAESLEKQRKEFEKKILEFKDIEETYDKTFLEIQEISSRTKENINAEVDFKERDLEKSRLLVKQSDRDESDILDETKEIEENISEQENQLKKKEEENLKLEKKFHGLLEKKTFFEQMIHQNNSLIFTLQGSLGSLESEINNLKVEKAKFNAEKENLDIDMKTYSDVQPLVISITILQEKLTQTQQILQTIGSVNLRALDVYDKVKEEYDLISEKANTLENEEKEIMKIIEEIDKKKRKTFTKTLDAINELFSRNFSQLSTKGTVFLELENPEDPFAGGLGITVKVGKGKYFDVTSLSGGEQTLVALSLIFAIQEYNPYCFYIFDEVDAALDKRNSERLAGLIKRYMKSGQYIVVTHNDAIITESSTLYGVSMQDGLSKILSLEI